MSVQERVGRVQYRSQQAENALKQLETCVEVINSKTKSGKAMLGSEKIKELEEENRRLQKEASDLKEKLIRLEYLNGIEQIPYNEQSSLKSSVVESQTESSPAEDTSEPRPQATRKPRPQEEKKKAKEKQPKASSTAGGAKGGSDKPLDVSRLDMRIGRILSAKRHPDADTLYVEEIDVGEDTPRTVCSGLVKNIPIDEINNRMIVVMCNLKPAKMRGVVSQAMVMCASSPDKVEILDPPVGVVPGDQIVVEGYPGTPDEVLNPKKKIFEQIQPDLNTNEEGVACYKGIPWMVKGKDGTVKSQTMKNSPIK